MKFFRSYLNELAKKVRGADPAQLQACVGLIRRTAANGKKVIIIGNGASATIASHVSIDLVKNARIRAVNFNEADLITCLANDYGYDSWLEKALELYARGGDLLIAISSSGRSKNILRAVQKAREIGMKVVSLSGFSAGNPLRKMGDLNFWVNSNSYNIVEITHSAWLVSLVDCIISADERPAAPGRRHE
ncbi:MAG: SIS domain-containing protein [Elusimicrobia bacterium]|nr:SIS domain-containing protein [Elusimicrobiota bacterium]